MVFVVVATIVVVGSTLIKTLVCRGGGDSTTRVTLGDNLIFNLVASTPSDPDGGHGGVRSDECDLCSAAANFPSSLPLVACGCGTEDDDDVILMVVEVLALTPTELSLAALPGE